MSDLFFVGAVFFILLFFISLGAFLYYEETGWGSFGMGISIIFMTLCLLLSYSFKVITGTIVDINTEESFFIIESEEEKRQKVRVFVEDWEVDSYKRGEKYTFLRSDVD